MALGTVLIILIARYAPEHGALPDDRAADDRPAMPAEQLEKLVLQLIEALGLEPVQQASAAGAIELTLRDPRPLGGGRLLLRATSTSPDPRQIGLFAEDVRAADEALKGILICPAGHGAEVRAAADSSVAPIELVDGPRLQALVACYLSRDRAERLSTFQGFTTATLVQINDVQLNT